MSHSIPKASPNPIDDLHKVDHDPNESRLLIDSLACLLPGIDEEAVSSARISNTMQPQTYFPKAQLATLFAVCIVDPIAYQQIFPYVNQLLADMRTRTGRVLQRSSRTYELFASLFLLKCTNYRKAPARSRKCFQCINWERYQVGRWPSASHKLTRCR